MKPFRWRLQRLLDVTGRREQMARWELLRLTRQMAQLRHRILHRQMEVQDRLAELGALPSQQRLARQRVFLGGCAATERQLDEWRRQLQDLQQLKVKATEAFMRLRNSRQTLERMREEARTRHRQEQVRQEQLQLDESAHLAKARQAQAGRR